MTVVQESKADRSGSGEASIWPDCRIPKRWPGSDTGLGRKALNVCASEYAEVHVGLLPPAGGVEEGRDVGAQQLVDPQHLRLVIGHVGETGSFAHRTPASVERVHRPSVRAFSTSEPQLREQGLIR